MMKPIALLLAIGWMQCASNQYSGHANPNESTFTLSADTPMTKVRLTLPGDEPQPDAFVLAVTTVENEATQAISITVSWEDETANETMLLGNISLFPPNQPGKFLVSMKKVWESFGIDRKPLDRYILTLHLEGLQGPLREKVQVSGNVSWGGK